MKKVSVLIIALLLVVSLASCSFDSLGEYKKAAEKTEQIEKGQSTVEFSMTMDFDTEGMTEEEIKEVNYFKEMKGSFNAAYDKGIDKGIIRSYLNFGGMGFDFNLFVNGAEVFMKLPVVGKYIRLDETQAPAVVKKQNAAGQDFISQETLDKMDAVWLGMVTQENIFKGKDIVLTTPDGEVKTIEYTIRLNDEQIKKLGTEMMDLLSKDEKLKKYFEEQVRKNNGNLEDISFEKMFSEVKESMKDYTSDGFSYTAYVDIDGYIVNEVIEFSMKTNSDGKPSVKGAGFRMDIKNWDINKEQQFDFPELTEENTVDMDSLDKDVPNLMGDLFKKKD